MRKWRVLGQAFENIGSDLSMACENMETNCEVGEAFEEMYMVYAMMLDTLKAQRRFAAAKFDEIDKHVSA